MPNNQFYAGPRNIIRSAAPVAGGLCAIYFALVEDIALLPAPTPATAIVDNPAGIVLKTGKFWYRLQGNPKRSYRHETKMADGGPFVETTVQAATPFDDPENHLTLDRLKYHKYIVLVERPDRTMRIVGSLDNPAILQHVTETGESQGDSAASTLRFGWTSEDLPLIYQGDVTPIYSS